MDWFLFSAKGQARFQRRRSRSLDSLDRARQVFPHMIASCCDDEAVATGGEKNRKNWCRVLSGSGARARGPDSPVPFQGNINSYPFSSLSCRGFSFAAPAHREHQRFGPVQPPLLAHPFV